MPTERQHESPEGNMSLLLCNFSDPDTYRICLGDRTFLFDFSERFGPMVVGKRGAESTQPGHRHLFWAAVTEWKRQGKRICPCGFCVWHPDEACRVSSEIFRHVSGRHYMYTGLRLFQVDRCCPIEWKLNGGDPQTARAVPTQHAGRYASDSSSRRTANVAEHEEKL